MGKLSEETTEIARLQRTTSFLPDSLKRLVTGETYWSENRGNLVERRWEPCPVPENLHHAAERTLADLDYELRPAERSWLVARIMTLLAHYWLPDMPENLQQAVGNDWAEILGKYPRHAIEWACKDYLASDTRSRPTPGQIRKLAEEHAGERMKQRDRLRQCVEYRPERQRGGIQRLEQVTREQALETAAKVKEQLRKEIAAENK